MLEVLSEIDSENILNGPLPDTGSRNVILIFWSYSNPESLETVKFIQDLKGSPYGKEFIFIGIHTPEFNFEKSKRGLEKAIHKLGVELTVVADNDFHIWSYFNNQFWPALYLFNKEGDLVGEFVEEFRPNELLNVLEEISGISINRSKFPIAIGTARKKLYLGTTRGDVDNSGTKQGYGVSEYSVPENISGNRFLLSGIWNLQSEYAEAVSDECYLVVRNENGTVCVIAGSDNEAEIIAETARQTENVKVLEPGLYGPFRNSLSNIKKIRVGKGIRVYALILE